MIICKSRFISCIKTRLFFSGIVPLYREDFALSRVCRSITRVSSRELSVVDIENLLVAYFILVLKNSLKSEKSTGSSLGDNFTRKISLDVVRARVKNSTWETRKRDL